MTTTITTQDFRAAKSAAKKLIKSWGGYVADSAKAHAAAMDVLRSRCPQAGEKLITDMGWQCVMAAR